MACVQGLTANERLTGSGVEMNDIPTHLDQRLALIAKERLKAAKIAVSRIKATAADQLGNSRIWFQYDGAIEREFVNALNEAARLVVAIAGTAAPQYEGKLEKFASDLGDEIIQWRERGRKSASAYGETHLLDMHIARMRDDLGKAQTKIVGDFRFGVVGGEQVVSRPVQTVPERDTIAETATWDFFVCHASEDKEGFVRPLARGLEARGFKVWFDEFTLRVGDSLRRSIDRGLTTSRFGIVVISPNFLLKDWPQCELDGLVAREIGGIRVILPVWHNISVEKIREYSPTLADRIAVSSAKGLEYVIAELVRALEPQTGKLRAAGPTTSMQTPHVERGTTFEDLPPGRLFRFYHGNEAVIGLKAICNYGNRDKAVLILTPTRTGLRSGDLLSPSELRDVVELSNVIVVQSTRPETTTPGAQNIAEPGEIELRDSDLVFITQEQDDSSVMRVNLRSGEISHATGARPVEIYSEWSLVRTDDQTETLYEHKRRPELARD
jgi:hypothetical protein